MAWKVLGLDGTQEVKVGRRRADVLAPGGFAVEFQASALDADEVRAREDDWAAQGGMAWVFKADEEFAAGRIAVWGSLRKWGDALVKPENRATVDITWSHAPERVRAARAPSFLDLGGEVLFVGAWRCGSSPLTGYGWRVPKDWVVGYLLRGSVVPAPLAEDPAEVECRLEAWKRREAERERRERQRRYEAERGDRGAEGRRHEAAVMRQGELRARRAGLAGPESGRKLPVPAPGFVITEELRAWRLAREAERAGERED